MFFLFVRCTRQLCCICRRAEWVVSAHNAHNNRLGKNFPGAPKLICYIFGKCSSWRWCHSLLRIPICRVNEMCHNHWIKNRAHAWLTEDSKRSHNGGLVSQLVPCCTVVLPSMVGTHRGEGQVLRGFFRKHVVCEDTIPCIPDNRRQRADWYKNPVR